MICDCIVFASPRSVFGAENLHHSLNQSDAKLIKKSYYLVTHGLVIFSSSSHWILKVFPFLLIDRCDCLQHSKSTLIERMLPTCGSSIFEAVLCRSSNAWYTSFSKTRACFMASRPFPHVVSQGFCQENAQNKKNIQLHCHVPHCD